MPRVDPLKNNFIAGEISPLFSAQSNSDLYKAGVALLENYFPISQGPITRRTGTSFINSVFDNDFDSRLIPFVFSETISYILEFSAVGTVQVYKDHATVPVTFAHPYSVSELKEVQTAQVGNLMVLTHSNHAPRVIIRTSDIAWFAGSLFKAGVFFFTGDIAELGNDAPGPFLPTDPRGITVTPGAVTGSTTLTASAPIFKTSAPDDTGRQMRILDNSAQWVEVIITAVTSDVLVNIDIIGNDFADLVARPIWQFGVYSAHTGYPRSVCFHEDRLILGGPPTFPGRLDASEVANYNHFRRTERDGTVIDTNALDTTAVSKRANDLLWLETTERGILGGTFGGEWVFTGVEETAPLSPNNLLGTRQISTYGNANRAVANVGKSFLALTASKSKLRELRYANRLGGFSSKEASLTGEHLMRPAVDELSYQSEPYSKLWMVRSDGVLVSALWSSEAENPIFGPSRHRLGGDGDAAGNPPIVKSVAVKPSPDGTRDEVWLMVERYVDGSVRREIEYITPEFEDTTDLDDAIFLDYSGTYDGVSTLTPGGGGEYSHLEGLTVDVVADGLHVGQKLVDATTGLITLDTAASVVHAGFNYNSNAKLLIDEGSNTGTALGKTQRIQRIALFIERAVSVKVGNAASNLKTFLTGTALFSGIKSENVDFPYELGNQVYIRQDTPLPGTILGVMPQLKSEDRQ